MLLASLDAAAAQPKRGTPAAEVEASLLAWKLAPGPHEVESAELEFPGAAGGRAIPLKAFAPKDDRHGGLSHQGLSHPPYPVIIFSHGAGGNRNVAPKLLRHWASHGYVVLAPSHADSVALQQEKGAKKTMGNVLRSFGTDPQLRISRVEDVRHIIDRLDELPQLAPVLEGKLDASRIGIGGHSAGAMTASLLGGAVVDMPANGEGGPEARSFRDERVDALLLLSGQGTTGPGGGFHKNSWEQMTLPAMVQTGSYDNTPRTRQTSASRRHPYEYAPPGDKYLLFIEGALHMSFTGRASGEEPGLAVRWLEQYLGTPGLDAALEYDQRAIFDYVITSSQAFWDAYLKDDADAKQWLQGDKLARLSKGQVEHQRK